MRRQVIFYPVEEDFYPREETTTNIYPIVFNPICDEQLKNTFWEHDYHNLDFDAEGRAWLYFKNEIQKRKVTPLYLTRQHIFWRNREEANRRLCFYRKPYTANVTIISFDIDQLDLPQGEQISFWEPLNPVSNPLRIVLERLETDAIIVQQYNSKEKTPTVYRTDLQSISGEIWYEQQNCDYDIVRYKGEKVVVQTNA